MTRLVVASLLTLVLVSPSFAIAQVTMFACEDFLTQASAQASLERMPDDPYNLDPDGNGIACEGMFPGGWTIMPLAEDDESDVVPAEYQIVEQEFQQVARPRVVMRIVVEDADDEETAAALAAAIAEGLDDESAAHVAHVFAYREGDDTDGGYTVGIAQGSRDGLGWTGDGNLGLQFDTQDESGLVTVLLDSAVADVEQRRLTVPLELDGRGEHPGPAVSQQQATSTSSDEAAYATEIGEQMTTVGESMSLFSELMAAPRIGQDDWTIQLAAVIVTWRFARDEALALTPPPALAEVHASYLTALDYLNLAGDDILVGIDTFDVALLDRAAGNLSLANAQIATTQALIDGLIEERGLASP